MVLGLWDAVYILALTPDLHLVTDCEYLLLAMGKPRSQAPSSFLLLAVCVCGESGKEATSVCVPLPFAFKV